jgi:hypothetical protein
MTDQSTAGGGSGPANASNVPTQPAAPLSEGGQTSASAPTEAGATKAEERGPIEPASPQPGATNSPFENEGEVMGQGVPMRDDISATQGAASATRDVSSNHMARLLYRPLDAPGGPVYQSQALERQLRARQP